MVGVGMTLINALKSYQQADMDGVMCVVSRQAVEEAIAEIERLRAENASLWERVKRWEPLADPNSVQSGKI